MWTSLDMNGKCEGACEQISGLGTGNTQSDDHRAWRTQETFFRTKVDKAMVSEWNKGGKECGERSGMITGFGAAQRKFRQLGM